MLYKSKNLIKKVFSIINTEFSMALILGFLIRFILAPLTFQDDISISSWVAHFVALGHFDVYQYISQKSGLYIAGTQVVTTAWGPFFYYLYAGYEILLSYFGILGPLSEWGYTYSVPNINSTIIFFLKLPNFVFDFSTAYFLLKIVNTGERKRVLTLWMFSPVVIMITYMMGQVDIIQSLFIILALYFGKQATLNNNLNTRNSLISLALLGVGASVKIFPLLLIPVFAIILGRGRWRVLTLLFAGFGSFAIIVLPFLSKAFLDSILTVGASGILVPFTGISGFPIFPFIIGYLLIIYWLLIRNKNFSFDTLWKYCLLVATLVFVIVVWIPQWYLWILPFVIIAVTKIKSLFPIYGILNVIFLMYTFHYDSIFWMGLFKIFDPELARYIGFNEHINFLLPFPVFYSIVISAFIVTSGFYCFITLRGESKAD